jgi:radical SAM superfamily enzyme YgiQ (UPF0313 family)
MNDSLFIYLIDLPTFPKGIISLSFPAIAATFSKKYKARQVDLNITDFSNESIEHFKNKKCLFVGLKVSCQNYKYAIEITQRLKSYDPELLIIWGGEYPTLLPEQASLYADISVLGAFENISLELISDIEKKSYNRTYNGKNNYQCATLSQPDYSIVRNSNTYLRSMGFPMETSRGCDKKCTFCMVHVMQPASNFKSFHQLKNELESLAGKFVNIVDYNIGSDRNHLMTVVRALAESEVTGWMGEMCLESLDDEDLLSRLAKSRCKIIYCGLETTSELSLKSINKATTNNIANYRRIVRKVQSYGIQIAAGIIVGMEGANAQSITETFKLYRELGLIYAKITFLTYNPGTKVFESMKRVGKYVTEDFQFFDGNHFTFVPHGVDRSEVLEALKKNLAAFYTLKNIYRRAKNAGLSGTVLWEFVYFNITYRDAYLKWLKYNIFEKESGFRTLLQQKFRKSLQIKFADYKIEAIRKNLK